MASPARCEPQGTGNFLWDFAGLKHANLRISGNLGRLVKAKEILLVSDEERPSLQLRLNELRETSDVMCLEIFLDRSGSVTQH